MDFIPEKSNDVQEWDHFRLKEQNATGYGDQAAVSSKKTIYKILSFLSKVHFIPKVNMILK